MLTDHPGLLPTSKFAQNCSSFFCMQSLGLQLGLGAVDLAGNGGARVPVQISVVLDAALHFGRKAELDACSSVELAVHSTFPGIRCGRPVPLRRRLRRSWRALAPTDRETDFQRPPWPAHRPG